MYYNDSKVSLTLVNGNFAYGWSMKGIDGYRKEFFLNSNWDYHSSGQDYNLKDKISKIESDYSRTNKYPNIFRIDNENYFYSDGNTNPVIIVAHLILEYLTRKINKNNCRPVELRNKYLVKKNIHVINRNGFLEPKNIMVSDRRLSDIIVEIFEQNSGEHGALDDCKHIFEYCISDDDMDDLFNPKQVIATGESAVKTLVQQVRSLTVKEQQEFMKLYLGEVIR